MDFSIRKLKTSDYNDVLIRWWKDWGWQAPAKDFLPDNGEGGMMVLLEDRPVCAGFIYLTSNSNIAWIEWIISDKNYKEERSKAISLLLDTLILTSEKIKIKYVFATNDNKNLINTFINKGFRKGSITTELIKKI